MPILRTLVLACAVLVPPWPVEGATPAETKAVGFEAVIAGSYQGKVSGPGVLMFLPQGGFRKQGYFFLADGQGVRAHGVTFVLPRGLEVGKHALTSPSPLDIGTVPSVRVDRDMGNAVASSQNNITGNLTLTAFPADERRLSGAAVAGSFAFETEDPQGQRITVRGTFAFKAK